MARVNTALLSIAVVVVFFLLDSSTAEFDQDTPWACLKPPGTYSSYASRYLCRRGYFCDCNEQGRPETNSRYGKDCKCSSNDLWPDHLNGLKE